MKSKQTLVRLSFCLIFCAAALWLSPAEAGLCGREVTTTYYAWIQDSDPSAYWCSPPLVGPYIPIDYYAHWDPIGGTYSDCQGNFYSWGDTTTCTGTDNTERDFAPCYCEINP